MLERLVILFLGLAYEKKPFLKTLELNEPEINIAKLTNSGEREKQYL